MPGARTVLLALPQFAGVRHKQNELARIGRGELGGPVAVDRLSTRRFA
jgi:hypothetical protein